jgi:hypothetical protein
MIGNHLWNATRVNNFLRALGIRPTRWEENIAHLAKMAFMSVQEFMMTDPISYAEIMWDYDKQHNTVKNILGVINYFDLVPYYDMAKHNRSIRPVKPKQQEMAKSFLGPLLSEPPSVESLQASYEKANADFEDTYTSAKCGASSWDVVDEAYEKLDAAAQAVANYREPVAEKNEIVDDYEQVKTKWKCPTCTAVWRTKAKTE